MRAIPSTLYQCISFFHEGQIYVIPGDPDPLAHCPIKPPGEREDRKVILLIAPAVETYYHIRTSIPFSPSVYSLHRSY